MSRVLLPGALATGTVIGFAGVAGAGQTGIVKWFGPATPPGGFLPECSMYNEVISGPTSLNAATTYARFGSDCSGELDQPPGWLGARAWLIRGSSGQGGILCGDSNWQTNEATWPGLSVSVGWNGPSSACPRGVEYHVRDSIDTGTTAPTPKVNTSTVRTRPSERETRMSRRFRRPLLALVMAVVGTAFGGGLASLAMQEQPEGDVSSVDVVTSPSLGGNPRRAVQLPSSGEDPGVAEWIRREAEQMGRPVIGQMPGDVNGDGRMIDAGLERIPYLIQTGADNGELGYVRYPDLMGSAPSTPEDALASMSGPRAIPVYASDGVTKIGDFTFAGRATPAYGEPG